MNLRPGRRVTIGDRPAEVVAVHREGTSSPRASRQSLLNRYVFRDFRALRRAVRRVRAARRNDVLIVRLARRLAQRPPPWPATCRSTTAARSPRPGHSPAALWHRRVASAPSAARRSAHDAVGPAVPGAVAASPARRRPRRWPSRRPGTRRWSSAAAARPPSAVA